MSLRARVVLGDSRRMAELEAGSVHLVVTSPPYWRLKDYGAPGQIGYGQSLHDYLRDLYRIWGECFRVLQPGRRFCLNIGDQFARKSIYGRYKVIPLHAEMIAQCESLGFDYMGAIIWQKKTTMETSGGAIVMGSYPCPPNGIVEIDYEYILLFKKAGQCAPVDRAIKSGAALTREEWKEYFSGHWRFGGARQLGHEAMFPDELPRRLIRMFSFPGETILDPFLGSGATLQVALELGRSAVGYEINEAYLDLIRRRAAAIGQEDALEILRQPPAPLPAVETSYRPQITDALPQQDKAENPPGRGPLFRVTAILSDGSLQTHTGMVARLLGVEFVRHEESLDYLRNRVLGKQIYVETEDSQPSGSAAPDTGTVEAYVYLKNRIFVNTYLLRSRLARADRSRPHRRQSLFEKLEGMRDEGQGMRDEG